MVLIAYVEKDSWDEVGGFENTWVVIVYGEHAAVSGDWEEILILRSRESNLKRKKLLD